MFVDVDVDVFMLRLRSFDLDESIRSSIVYVFDEFTIEDDRSLIDRSMIERDRRLLVRRRRRRRRARPTIVFVVADVDPFVLFRLRSPPPRSTLTVRPATSAVPLFRRRFPADSSSSLNDGRFNVDPGSVTSARPPHPHPPSSDLVSHPPASLLHSTPSPSPPPTHRSDPRRSIVRSFASTIIVYVSNVTMSTDEGLAQPRSPPSVP